MVQLMAKQRAARQAAAAEAAALAAVPDLYNQPLFYVLPILTFQLLMAICASANTRHTYGRPGHYESISLRSLCTRIARVFPYVIISTGMLPHQVGW